MLRNESDNSWVFSMAFTLTNGRTVGFPGFSEVFYYPTSEKCFRPMGGWRLPSPSEYRPLLSRWAAGWTTRAAPEEPGQCYNPRGSSGELCSSHGPAPATRELHNANSSISMTTCRISQRWTLSKGLSFTTPVCSPQKLNSAQGVVPILLSKICIVHNRKTLLFFRQD